MNDVLPPLDGEDALFELAWPALEERILARITQIVAEGAPPNRSHQPPDAEPSSARATQGIVSAELPPRLYELKQHCREIERAIDLLYSDLNELCEEAQATGFCEVSVWLTFPDASSVETVAGAGDTPIEFHHLRRGIPEDTALHDIVVDVMRRRVAERHLGGHPDKRYDEYLRVEEDHGRFKDRLFVPLCVLRDTDGTLSSSHCRWSRQEQDKEHELWVPQVDDPALQVESIGLLSLSNPVVLSGASIEDALRLSTRIAQRVYGVTLQGVIDRMLGVLRRASRARSATIHFVPDGNALDYFRRDEEKRGDTPHVCYVARYRSKCAQREGDHEAGVIGGPPRSKGIGVLALQDGQPRYLSGEDLETANPGLWADRVRGLAVYPLRTGSNDSVGLVYLHQFEGGEDLSFEPELELLVDRVAHGLSQAARELRQRRKAQERAAINHVVRQFLSSSRKFEDMKDLLEAFAGALATFLGADAVLIHERSGFTARAGRFAINEQTRTGHASAVRTVVYSRTNAGLAREVKVPLIVDGEKIGTVVVGYAQGNSLMDEALINKLVELGGSALKLSQVSGKREREITIEQEISEFRQRQRGTSGESAPRAKGGAA